MLNLLRRSLVGLLFDEDMRILGCGNVVTTTSDETVTYDFNPPSEGYTYLTILFVNGGGWATSSTANAAHGWSGIISKLGDNDSFGSFSVLADTNGTRMKVSASTSENQIKFVVRGDYYIGEYNQISYLILEVKA